MRLTEEYGIVEDSRFRQCAREARTFFILFVLGAVAAVGLIYVLTTGRDPTEYGTVLGLPSYIFWGVIVVDAVFLGALLMALRTLFQEMDLDPEDPAASDEPTGGPAREAGA